MDLREVVALLIEPLKVELEGINASMKEVKNDLREVKDDISNIQREQLEQSIVIKAPIPLMEQAKGAWKLFAGLGGILFGAAKLIEVVKPFLKSGN